MSAPLDVLHEDDDVLVVDKPAGLVCHPTKGDEWSSLIGRVRLHLGHAEGRLVNRLDRETSGVVLIAKVLLRSQLTRRTRLLAKFSRRVMKTMISTR